MRITIDFLPEEEAKATESAEAIRRINPGIKVRIGRLQTPYKHLYLTTRNHGKPCAASERDLTPGA